MKSPRPVRPAFHETREPIRPILDLLLSGIYRECTCLTDQGFTGALRQWATTGPLGALIAAHHWSGTSLGPIDSWPPALKTLVALMLNSRQPMFIAWGPDRIWLYNDAFVPIAGRKHPGCLGQPADVVWSEAWSDLEPLFNQVWAGQPVHMDDFAIQLDRNDKLEEAHFAFSYTPAQVEDGTVSGLFGVCIEITNQVIANRALEAQQQRFARLFDQAPTFMAMLRGEDHVIELANPRYLELVGHRDVLGRTVAEALPDAVAQGYLALLDTVFKNNEAYSAIGSKYSMQKRPGGPSDERYVDFVFQPIVGGDGLVIGIFVQGVDVTERKMMEIALQAANNTLERRVAERTETLQNIQTFYTHSSECHATLCARDDGSFEYCEINPATLRLYGMAREDVIGKTIEDIFPPDYAAELSAHLAEALRRDSPYRYSRRHAAATVEAVVTPIPRESGRRRRLAVTARDITERQNLEEQLRQAQKMEAVGQLTGGLAHDFNNLLQGIIGALDRVQHRIAAGRAGEVDRFLNAAVESANRAAALTHRLLAFSRRQTLDPRPTDVNRLIGGMEDLIRRTVGPDISVEVVGAGGLWPTRVDAPQLESALLNLCINARDAMPNGGRLTIETANKWLDERSAPERELPPGQYLSLCVSDTGTGMPPDVVARAFDPFFTTKPLGQGTGLGLSMIYGFARQSGGQVRIYTEVGRGTTMSIYLPRYIGAADEAETPSPELVDHGAGETVVIVDDELTVRMLVAEVLEENGYNLLEAGDGPSALKLFQTDRHVDLLITDVGLPGGMNGRQLADALRVARQDLKVLFITGYAENAAVNNGHLGHGMEILTKPFAMATLANKVRKILES
jgi:PAS domain S-box-containing protein